MLAICYCAENYHVSRRLLEEKGDSTEMKKIVDIFDIFRKCLYTILVLYSRELCHYVDSKLMCRALIQLVMQRGTAGSARYVMLCSVIYTSRS